MLLVEETLTRALQKTAYWHQIEVQRPARELIAKDSALMFSAQAYDVLLAVYMADLSEATAKEKEDDRKVAIILAAITTALAARLARDAAMLRPGLLEALTTAVVHGGLSRYGIEGSLNSIRAEQYLLNHGAELVKGINEFTREEFKTILANGLRDGLSTEDVASRLMAKMDDYRYYRAQRIARTEASKAWSFAEMQSAGLMEEAGYKMVKEWLLGPMHEVFDPCDHNHEAGAIPLKQLFPAGDMAPPQHVSCGCSLITYPAGGSQPWGTPVDGALPFMPYGFDQGDQNAR